jgi:hypothetical protein
MKKSISLYGFIILALSIGSNAVFALPSIKATTSQGTTIKFTATLSEKLLSGYKVKIDYGNGKGLVAMTCSGATCTLSSNALPVGVSQATYKIGVYNAQGVLQGSTKDGTYTIISAPTTGYSKISNTGSMLPDSAILGSGQNDWACTKDNKTGLVWEVKTADGGLRDMSQKYTNLISGETGYGLSSNSDFFANTVNKQTLCGSSNWRLPTSEELNGLVLCSDSQYTKISLDTGGNICTNKSAVAQPTINATFFPNTQNLSYWTSSLFLSNKNGGYYLNFNGEGLISFDRSSSLYIRLVHDEKPITGNISNAIADKAVVAYLTTQKTVADKTAFDYLTTLKTTAEKTAADYLIGLKSTADKTAADYLTTQITSADKTASNYLTTQKLVADKTAADYLATLKAAADNTFPPVASLGSYSKISNSGMKLPDSAKLGTGANDWACTKDNKTGLVWEVKTADGGLRDSNTQYSNYNVFSAQSNSGDTPNATEFNKLVNKQSLCGASNWRLPTKDEMLGLIFCSDGNYETWGSCKNPSIVISPTINETYFPNTSEGFYWSSSPYQDTTDKTLGVNFYEGIAQYSFKHYYKYVRLLH